MSNFYIYSYIAEDKKKSTNKAITVIFCPREEIDIKILKDEIREYYEHNTQADYIYVLGGSYMRVNLKSVFLDSQETTFDIIPKVNKDFFNKSLNLVEFNENGKFTVLHGIKQTNVFFERLVNEGLTKIFRDRGGLIEAQLSHHFVFPSNKHCDKFIRTGNVLLHTSEIYFIALNLLKYFNEDVKKIYCDTSSIISLAFALYELKKRFKNNLLFPAIESFSSYDGFENQHLKYASDCLILISSSTSCNIIDRIVQSINTVNTSQVVIVYFLGELINYRKFNDQIVCCLTKNDKNPNGYDVYETYKNEIECKLCKDGSVPVKIIGDVFLLEKPKVRKITLVKSDAPSWLSEFVEEFVSVGITKNNIIKCYYKESPNPDHNYEIYIDFSHVLKTIGDRRLKLYTKFREKFSKYISLYIPSDTKYIIHLPDEASKIMAQMVLNSFKNTHKISLLPKIVPQEDYDKIIDAKISGSAVIVTSSIVLGRNLLFISRAMRNYEKMSLVYLIGLSRTQNEDYLKFIDKNLGQGKYGISTNPFHYIYKIYISNSYTDSSWSLEKDFLLKFQDFCEKNYKDYEEALTFISERILVLENASSTKGLANKIFYNNIILGNELRIRKNFAFLNFNGYHLNASQADIYFVILSILNQLRTSKDLKRALLQTEYVRNIIDPENFERFNDGIIQASLLRACSREELNYSIDDDSSIKMKSILNNVIKYHHLENGEALMEFVFAIASKKMRIKETHLVEIISSLSSIKSNIIQAYCNYIKEVYSLQFYFI